MRRVARATLVGFEPPALEAQYRELLKHRTEPWFFRNAGVCIVGGCSMLLRFPSEWPFIAWLSSPVCFWVAYRLRFPPNAQVASLLLNVLHNSYYVLIMLGIASWSGITETLIGVSSGFQGLISPVFFLGFCRLGTPLLWHEDVMTRLAALAVQSAMLLLTRHLHSVNILQRFAFRLGFGAGLGFIEDMMRRAAFLQTLTRQERERKGVAASAGELPAAAVAAASEQQLEEAAAEQKQGQQKDATQKQELQQQQQQQQEQLQESARASSDLNPDKLAASASDRGKRAAVSEQQPGKGPAGPRVRAQPAPPAEAGACRALAASIIGARPTYRACSNRMLRISMKIHDREPEQLVHDWQVPLQQFVHEHGSASLHAAYILRGCTQIIMDVRLEEVEGLMQLQDQPAPQPQQAVQLADSAHSWVLQSLFQPSSSEDDTQDQEQPITLQLPCGFMRGLCGKPSALAGGSGSGGGGLGLPPAIVAASPVAAAVAPLAQWPAGRLAVRLRLEAPLPPGVSPMARHRGSFLHVQLLGSGDGGRPAAGQQPAGSRPAAALQLAGGPIQHVQLLGAADNVQRGLEAVEQNRDRPASPNSLFLNVELQLPSQPGLLHLELHDWRSGALGAAAPLLLLPSAAAAQEVCSLMEAAGDCAELRTFVLDFGHWMEVADSPAPARGADALREGSRLFRFCLESAMPACMTLIGDLLLRGYRVPLSALLHSTGPELWAEAAARGGDNDTATTDRSAVALTPLHLAVKCGHCEVLLALVAWAAAHGVSPDWSVPGSRGLTPLHLAAMQPNRDELVLAALEGGGNAAARAWLSAMADDGRPPAAYGGSQVLSDLAQSILDAPAQQHRRSTLMPVENLFSAGYPQYHSVCGRSTQHEGQDSETQMPWDDALAGPRRPLSRCISGPLSVGAEGKAAAATAAASAAASASVACEPEQRQGTRGARRGSCGSADDPWALGLAPFWAGAVSTFIVIASLSPGTDSATQATLAVWMWPYLLVLAMAAHRRLVAVSPRFALFDSRSSPPLMRACRWLLSNFWLVGHLNRMLVLVLISFRVLCPRINVTASYSARLIIFTAIVHAVEAYDFTAACLVIVLLQMPVIFLYYTTEMLPSPWMNSFNIGLVSVAAQGLVALRKAAAARARQVSHQAGKAKTH